MQKVESDILGEIEFFSLILKIQVKMKNLCYGAGKNSEGLCFCERNKSSKPTELVLDCVYIPENKNRKFEHKMTFPLE